MENEKRLFPKQINHFFSIHSISRGHLSTRTVAFGLPASRFLRDPESHAMLSVRFVISHLALFAVHVNIRKPLFVLFVCFLSGQHLGFNSWLYDKQYVLASLTLFVNFNEVALPPPKTFWLLSLLEYHSNIIWNVTTHTCLFHMRPSFYCM